MKSDILKLNQEKVTASLLKSNKCVIFIEIEALPHLKFSKVSIPTNEVIEQLNGLLIDTRNIVVILSTHTTD